MRCLRTYTVQWVREVLPLHVSQFALVRLLFTEIFVSLFSLLEKAIEAMLVIV